MTLTPELLGKHEYKAVQDALSLHLAILMSQPMLAEEELEAFIRTAERSMTLSPFLDPTLFMHGASSLRQVIDDASDTLALVRAIRKRHPELKP